MTNNPITRFQTLRMIWLDAFIAAGDFPLRRQHLCLAFDISTPQASLDLRRYMAAFPDRLIYDRSKKCYHAAPGSKPAFADHEHSDVFRAFGIAADICKRLGGQ